MQTSFSLSTTSERIDKIDSFIKEGMYTTKKDFINDAIDKFFELHNTNYTIDFMYFIGVPLFLFLVSIGLTLYFSSLFWYIITGISGIYLMVFVYLFYDKYKGIKWQKG